MKKLLLLLGLLLVVSCKMVNKAVINHLSKSFVIDSYSNGTKEVVYLPMVHLGKPEFYQKVKKSLDSLRSLDYVIYYESVAPEKNLDSLKKIEVWKKFRKVTGLYIDYSNKELFRSFDIEGYVMQSAENTGIDVNRDIHADVPLNKLIAIYEKEKGEILLSDYDIKTPLNEKYKTRKVNKQDRAFLIDSLRNRNLFKMVNESKAKKIAVVYGKLHKYPLFTKLKQQDSLWRIRPVWESRDAQKAAVRKGN